MVTLNPLDSRSAPIEALASPFPREDTTPPVTNMNLVFICFFPSLIGLKSGSPFGLCAVGISEGYSKRCDETILQ